MTAAVEYARGLRPENGNGNENENDAENGVNGEKDSWNLDDHAGSAGCSLNVIDSEVNAANVVNDSNVNEANVSANGSNANCAKESGSHARRR